MTQYQICSRSLHDTTVPGIIFDEQGVCNYCKIYDKLCKNHPRGEQGEKAWKELINRIKISEKGKVYDCVIGVSGGTDSCWLLHLVKEAGLRPLAVNLDNGFGTDIAVKNIKNVIEALNIDLETYVIDYEEIKDLLLCYMKASLPWIDIPTDLAIMSSLYKIAAKIGVKYVFVGNDFRSEGSQPNEWTHGDGLQLKYLHKRFGNVPLKTFPNLTMTNLLYYSYIKRIKMVRPFYYLEYNKQEAKGVLKEKYGWEDYGGHHHENIFTKFAVAYWLPKKFKIDKRIITLSAQVLSGHMDRNKALEELSKLPYNESDMERDKYYTIKKLGITETKFDQIWSKPNKFYYDYPSYYPTIEKFLKIVAPLFKYLLPWKPMMFYQMEVRKEAKKR